MKEQFGTVAVREARLTKDEVANMVAEVLALRGPSSYDFDYKRPILLWQPDGGLIVRWPQKMLRDDDGRSPSYLKLMSWPEFIAKEASKEINRRDRAEAKPPDAPPADNGGTTA